MNYLENINHKTYNGIIEYIGSNGKEINGVLYKNAKIINFEGKEFIVSNNTILTIQNTDICNANCEFCFNGITFYPNEKDEYFSNNLKKIIDFCEIAEIDSVTISGGEPTIDINNLIKLINLLKGKFNNCKIHTNGYNLLTKVKGTNKRLIDILIESGFNKISLSLAHYEFQKNEKLMNFRGSFKGLNEKDIEELGKLSDKASIRLSCFINKEGIWTNEDIEKYIQFGKRNNINNFIFRASSNLTTPENYIKNTKFIDFNQNNITNIDNYVYHLKKLGYEESFSVHKSDIHVHVLKEGNVKVDFEQSNEEEDTDNKIRRINYFPNGVTYTSWIDPTELLFEEDKEKIIDNILYNPEFNNKFKYPADSISRNISERVYKNLSGDYQYPVDFHIHSINSDGKKDEFEILKEAKKQGVEVLTFTEHNFISENYEDIKKYANTLDIKIPFPGVEINVVTNPNNEPDKKHHLLAYGESLLDSQFQELIRLPIDIKNQFYGEIIEDLRYNKGLTIPNFEDILKGIDENGYYTTPNKKQMTRTHIAIQIQKITGEDLETIKGKYIPLIPSRYSYKEYLKAEDIIPIINELGGISGLAHPGWNRPFSNSNNSKNSYKYLLNEIWRLKKLGMSGIEVNHKSHSKETTKILQKFSKETMMIIVGGSDYHGKRKSKPEHYNIFPGTFGLNIEEYKNIYNLIN